MAGSGPRILVVADDPEARLLVASTLVEAGFCVAAAAEPHGALPALAGEPVAAAVVALRSEDAGIAFVAEARRFRPGLPALLVLPPGAARLVEVDCATILRRPLDPRQLLGCLFELVLRDDEDPDGPPPVSHAAEFGIAAARLACLCNRRDIAAAAGASRLAQDLTRQIGETRSAYRRLAAVQIADTGTGAACSAWSGS